MTAPDPSTELMQMINCYRVSQALHVAATLGVADLKDGPKPYDVVARTCGAHPASLYRLLRALAAIGVFHETSKKEFSLTPLGACLTSDASAGIPSRAVPAPPEVKTRVTPASISVSRAAPRSGVKSNARWNVTARSPAASTNVFT